VRGCCSVYKLPSLEIIYASNLPVKGVQVRHRFPGVLEEGIIEKVEVVVIEVEDY
jgi:hypothetical protein